MTDASKRKSSSLFLIWDLTEGFPHAPFPSSYSFLRVVSLMHPHFFQSLPHHPVLQHYQK
jgi:hypothetical protein